jgi:NADP-dependent 3-hydroxy acid dehydrogenase YdfG
VEAVSEGVNGGFRREPSAGSVASPLEEPMPDHVKGKVVVVTGAAGGFGRLVAQKCAARGARVVAADIDEKGLDETVASIVGSAGAVEGVRTDVTSRDEMSALARRAVAAFGAIDVMVNNAGVMPLAHYADHAEAAEAWDRCIDINLKGVLHGICAVHDTMIEQGRGHIVNVSSIYGNYPVAGAAVYSATKAAVNVLSEALRQESRGRIKVTTIRPTGVPATGLGAGIVNPAAISGILGTNESQFMETLTQIMEGTAAPELTDPDRIEYFALAPDQLADQIVYAIDQPWGVSISDLTVRASGDSYGI